MRVAGEELGKVSDKILTEAQGRFRSGRRCSVGGVYEVRKIA